MTYAEARRMAKESDKKIEDDESGPMLSAQKQISLGINLSEINRKLIAVNPVFGWKSKPYDFSIYSQYEPFPPTLTFTTANMCNTIEFI